MRVVRVLRGFTELRLILGGIAQASKTLVWICLLLGLLLYICSILCARIIGKSDLYPGYNDGPAEEFPSVAEFNSYQRFGTISRSMFSLLAVALLTDDWDIISRAVFEQQPLLLAVLYVVLCFATFGLLNVIIGVIVDNVVNTEHELEHEHHQVVENREMLELHVIQRFVESYQNHGGDSGTVDKDELAKIWDQPEMKDIIKHLRLPYSFGPSEFMQILDTNGDGELKNSEFVKETERLVKFEAEAENAQEVFLMEDKLLARYCLKKWKKRQARSIAEAPTKQPSENAEETKPLTPNRVGVHSNIVGEYLALVSQLKELHTDIRQMRDELRLLGISILPQVRSAKEGEGHTGPLNVHDISIEVKEEAPLVPSTYQVLITAEIANQLQERLGDSFQARIAEETMLLLRDGDGSASPPPSSRYPPSARQPTSARRRAGPTVPETILGWSSDDDGIGPWSQRNDGAHTYRLQGGMEGNATPRFLQNLGPP